VIVIFVPVLFVHRLYLRITHFFFELTDNDDQNFLAGIVSVCKISKINVKYVTCASAKRDDQNSAKMGACFIRVYVFAFAGTFNKVFCFFFTNQTSSKDEFFPTEFFIDDQFFMEILIDSTF
jgi:hypothetical protein